MAHFPHLAIKVTATRIPGAVEDSWLKVPQSLPSGYLRAGFALKLSTIIAVDHPGRLLNSDTLKAALIMLRPWKWAEWEWQSTISIDPGGAPDWLSTADVKVWPMKPPPLSMPAALNKWLDNADELIVEHIYPTAANPSASIAAAIEQRTFAEVPYADLPRQSVHRAIEGLSRLLGPIAAKLSVVHYLAIDVEKTKVEDKAPLWVAFAPKFEVDFGGAEKNAGCSA